MIQKEINEIRRRLSGDKSCINKLYGCFVNKQKEVISRFDSSVALMPQKEKELFLSLIKKVLSGGIGKSMIDITFSTQQVVSSDEHKLLMELKNSNLTNETVREELINKIIHSVNMQDENYLILMAADTYDVPYKDYDAMSGSNDSTEVFSYILCCICPVQDGKSQLGYMSEEKEFHTFLSPQVVSAPYTGFMFPAFDNRSSNIYNALFYTKNPDILQDSLIESLFCTEIPMSAPQQKETFSGALTNTLENECSFDVVQSVHEQIKERIVQHKESKEPVPLELTANDVGNMLKYSGISEEKVAAFCKKCDEDFGENASLNPSNIIDSKKFEVVTPQVKITVDPEYTYVVETKVINGRKYLLIPADDGVSVNGINIKIPKEDA